MTADGFDPYHKWLGIPPEEQPPTHYRLLGIAQLEADRDVIANAASRQAFHLRQLQDGPQGALAQRLLKDVAAAKATLLDPEAKAKYDQSFAPEVEQPLEEIVPVASFQRKPGKTKGKRKSKGFDPVPLLVRAVPLIVIAAILLVILNASERKAAPKTELPEPELVATNDVLSQPPAAVGGAQPAPDAQLPDTQLADHPTPVADSDDEPADRPFVDPMAEDLAATDDPDSAAMDSAAMEPEAPEPDSMEPASEDPAEAAPAKDGGMVAASSPLDEKMPPDDSDPAAEMDQDSDTELDATKQPVPTEDDQSKAAKLVRSRHKADFAKAKTADLKASLAKTLLAAGRDMDDDATNQYAFFVAAVDLATAAGDFELAIEGWNDLGEHYQVDALARQWEVLEKAAKTKQVEARKSALQQFVEDSMEHDRYDLARNALKSLLAASDSEESRQYENELKNVDAIAARYREAKAAFAELKVDPADPEANQTAGEFLSFFKLDWSQGLLLLSRSSDAALKPLALEELTQPNKSKAQVHLADQWWDFADQQSDEKIKSSAKIRARYWYMEALPELKDDARAKAEKRATLEARVQQSAPDAKITPEVLKEKFAGKASYDAATDQLTLVYDFQDEAQLKDFEGDATLTDGEINVSLLNTARHVVKFKTLKISGIVTMKSKVGDVVRGSGGLHAQRDAASVKISSGRDVASASEKGPADDDLVLPFEMDANEKLVLFRLGEQVVGRPMAKSEPGQVELCGGDAGAQFSQLAISGQPDPAWLAEFFDLPTSSADKNPPTKAKAPGKFEHIEKVVLWNEHNANHNNSGTKTCNVILSRSGKSVWQKKDLEIPWEAGKPTKLAVDVPQIVADSVRVEITATKKENAQSGGLAEVEVFDKAGKNLAAGAQVIVSAEPDSDDPRKGATLVDGITDSEAERTGYWLLPVGQLGWAEIRLLPEEAPPPTSANRKQAGTTKETPKTGGKTTRKALDGKIFASCDDAFEMCVNGIHALSGKGQEAVTAGTALKSGDVITVKATNDQRDVGFCCVIRLSNDQTITTSGGWRAYIPNNPEQWSMPKQIANVGPVVPGNSEWPADLVKSASKTDAALIWAPGNDTTCYLFFVVGKLDIPKKKAGT